MTTQYNVTTYGTLTNTNGVLSNFSASNYATIPLTFNPVQHPYEIVFKVNTGTMPTDANGTLWQTGDVLTSRGRLDLEIWHDRFYAELAANEDLVWSIDGITTVSSNTDYYAKLTYNGIDTYGLYLSTDGTTWTTEGTATSSAFLGDGTAEYNIIGVAPDNGGMIIPWLGSIDLNESYININGIRWWQGVTSISNVQTKIQLRHDTAANWTSINPVLLEGEVGIETDTLKQKVGDGVTAWNSLPYQNEIFIAEHSVTTYADTLNAYNAGKTILLTIGNGDYHGILYTYTGEEFRFVVFSESGSNKEIIFFKLNQYSGWNNGTSKTIVNDNLSNVTTISSNSAVQTALDSKVNKSGDTMTGTLTIQDGQCLIATDYDKGSAPSTTRWNSLEFVGTNNSTAWKDKRLGIVELTSNTDSSSSLGLRCYQNATSSTNYSALTLNMSSSGVASCTFPNTTCVDGQFVSMYQEAVGSTAYSLAKSTSNAWTFSNLPAKNCLVWVSYKCGTSQDVAIYSDLLTGTNMRATGTASGQAACLVIPVSSSKKIYLSNLSTSTAVNISFFRIFGYRVLGSNVNT